MNRLCKKLEAGDGSVNGMKMLLPVSKTALFEVQVVGISFDKRREGVAITVKPIHGAGAMVVSATELCDNTKVARGLYYRRAEADEYKRARHIQNNSDRNWRSLLCRERALLTDEQRVKFDKRAEKLLGGPISKASEQELHPVWANLLAVKFDLDELPEISNYY